MACKRSPVRLRYSPQKNHKAILNGVAFVFNKLSRLAQLDRASRIAFGKVTGSTPVFSTNINPAQKRDFFMFTLYILYSTKLDKFYIGYTADVEKRLREHNSDISTFTAKANDWILEYSEKIL